ncbi:MAG: response regulator, partial [Chlorobiales bacterium]|nr:response regulator [Chlorobiales bacterium]
MTETAIKVLLIEDDRIDRMAFERLVKSENLPYTYTIAGSVSEAKKNLASEKYDIIISDYNLGDGTAAEIFDSIVDTPVIFATGGGDEEIAVNAMKSGAYDYLVKDPDRNYLKVLPVTVEKALRHKEAEERLRLFESVIVNGNDAVIITDAEYGSMGGAHIIYVNDAFLQITGYKPEEIMGKTPMMLFGEKTHRRDLVRIKKAILNAQSVRVELIAYRKNRTEFWVDINVVPVADNSGKYTHWVSVLRDITSRKKTEEDLIKAKQLAEESMKAKEQFLANMSHEIRTPMNAVVGLTNLMLNMRLDPEQREYVEAIKQSSDNLLVIINDILDISKIEAGKISFEKIPFSINDLLNRLVKSVKVKAVEKGLTFSLAVDASLPEVVTGDPVRLNQILVNLVGNAIKFTEKGSLTVDARLYEDADDEVNVLFEVTDTGIGISGESLDKIFESFSQATSDTTRKFGGTGLGLTISKQLVELQNGEMRVKSKPNEGSTFSFIIPLKKGGTITVQNASLSGPEQQINLEHLRVLLVEDNPMNRFVATKTLATWKITVDTAENGKQALEMVGEKPYDLILMDVQMPEMDGYEATRRIRKE